MDDHDLIEATIVAAQPADDHIVSLWPNFISICIFIVSFQTIYLNYEYALIFNELL